MLSLVPTHHSLEAEQAVLGCALLSSLAATRVLAGLQREDFFLPAHRQVFDAIADLARCHSPVDLVTVMDELRDQGVLEKVGGSTYLVSLTDSVAATAHTDHYIAIVKEKSELRWLEHETGQFLSGLADTETTAAELRQALVRKFLARDQGRVEMTLADLRQVAFEEADRVQAGTREEVALTGIEGVDRYSDGLPRGEIAIVCGRPGTGKTAAALQIARHAATHWGPVLFASLETKGRDLARRDLARRSRLPFSHIRDAGIRTGQTIEPLSDHAVEGVARAAADLARLPHGLYVCEDCYKLSALIYAAQLAHVECGTDLIIVDYGQLVRDEGAKSRVEEVSRIARELKNSLARPLNVPVYVMAQATRYSEQRAFTAGNKNGSRAAAMMQLSDIGWAGEWEAVAYTIHLLSRDPSHEQTEAEDEVRVPIRWHVAKNRNGRTGVVKLWFEKPRFQFVSQDERHETAPPDFARATEEDRRLGPDRETF